MKLSLYEQETIILYNQAEATAEVYSHDPRLLEKLRRLAEIAGEEPEALAERLIKNAEDFLRTDNLRTDK